MAGAGRLAQRLGWQARASERSIWLIVDGPEGGAAAARLAAAFEGRFGRLHIYATTASGDIAPAPFLTPLPRPSANAASLALTFRRLRTRAVVQIGQTTRFAEAVETAATKAGLTTLAWSGEGAPGADLAERLQTAMRANPRNVRLQGRRARLAEAALDGRLPLQWRYRRLAGLDALRDHLGRPERIFCLGSGPSSNDRAAVAAAEAADAVFRVKHRWLRSGKIARADVAFTGTPATAAALPRATILAQDRTTAGRIALARAWRAGWKPLTLGVVEDLAPGYAMAFDDGARLTNGAAMLAMAVALQPRRLIVAGVDLYSHPDGAYPGEAQVENAYAPAHDAARERDFALAMLRRQADARGADSLQLIGPLGDIARAEGLNWGVSA